MKRILTLLLFASLCWNYSTAQDIIKKFDGEEIKAVIIEVGPVEIKYKKANNPNGPVYVILKSDVESIVYINGTVDNFIQKIPPVNQEEDYAPAENTGVIDPELDLFSQGQMDARKYYDGYKPAGTGTLVCSLASPLIGLVPAIGCSMATPKDENLFIPSRELRMQKDYFTGYITQAKRIKQNKVWTNWGIGFGVNLFIVFAIVASA